MVQTWIADHPAFWVAGKATWIETVEDFGTFWAQCHQDGTAALLKGLTHAPGPVTGSHILGVSRVENDPEKRTFDFYVGAEVPPSLPLPEGLTRFLIPAARWAITTGEGEMLDALYEAEMYAFGALLQQKNWQHAPLPELEVYPANGGAPQFWLPILPRQ